MAKKTKLERRQARKAFFEDFKKFISKGNAFMLAVGVVIGSAFTAIVNAFVKIITSVCTWWVPGGITGLVTPLPALTATQRGVEGIGQSFSASDLVEATIAYAKSQGVIITAESEEFIQWQNSLKSLYTLYGGRYFYNATAIIDWGTLINAFISFIIIAIVLFILVKVITKVQKIQDDLKAKALEEYYKKHPEERPAPLEEGEPEPTELDILKEINSSLQKLAKSNKE